MTHPPATHEIAIWYATLEELHRAWVRDLALGALFVPTHQGVAAGSRVRVVIELPFCEGSLDLGGEVVGEIATELAITGATPGLSVRSDLPVAELQARLEELTGTGLPEPAKAQPGRASAPKRFDTQVPVVIEADGREYSAKAVDISYNGLLVLLPGIDLGDDTEVNVRLTHSSLGQQLELEGKVARQTRCNGGVMAVGIRFNYGFGRMDEVTGFIDDLRGFERASKLASITGSLEETALEVVLETFTSVANQGTLLLARGEEQGIIAYRDGEIVCAMTGLVSGVKALGRMFTWTDARFEFQSTVELADLQTPLPLDSAIIAAAIERDEFLRLNLGELMSADQLSVNEALLSDLKAELEPLQQEIAENARMGFPPVALLDILPEADATIYRVLAELIEIGILRID